MLSSMRSGWCGVLLALASSFATACSDDPVRSMRPTQDAGAVPDLPDGGAARPAAPGTTSSNPIAKCNARFGNTFINRALSASADGAGNFLVLIQVVGMVDVGAHKIDGSAVAVVKLDSNCEPLGFQTIAAGDEVGLGPKLIAADRGGTSYIALSSVQNGRFGLFQITAAGKLGWSRVFQSSVIGGPTALALGADGSIFLAGSFTGALDFGRVTHDADDAVFVAKFDPHGNTIWSQAAPTTAQSSGEDPTGMVVDSAGDVLVWGTFSNTIDFGGGVLERGDSQGSNTYLAKLGRDTGAHMMSRAFRNLIAGRMVVGADGALWIHGRTQGFGGDMGCGPFPAMTSQNFLAKMSADGQRCLGSRAFSPNVEILQLAVDGASNVLFAGTLSGVVDLGAGMIGSPVTGPDFLLASFNSSGTYRFARTWAGQASQVSRSAIVDPSGGIGLLGDFESTIDFGLGPLATNPARSGQGGPAPRDIFFARY